MGIDYKGLSRRTQKFIPSRPVIVLDSGASIPHGLPSMSGLADKLLEKIDIDDTNWKLFEAELARTTNQTFLRSLFILGFELHPSKLSDQLKVFNREL